MRDRTGIDRHAPEAQLRLRQASADLDLIEQLRRRREQLGLTQQQVADRMGRHQSVVSNLERLGSDPRLSSIRRYANALGVIVEYHVCEPSRLPQELIDRLVPADDVVSVEDETRRLAAQLRAQM